MKRILLMACLLVGLFLVAPVKVEAAETVASGSAGDSVNWVLTDDGTLTISGSGDMVSYNSGTYQDAYSYPWYSYRDSISSLVVQSGVTSVGRYAFGTSSYSFSSVSLSDSIVRIEDYAFQSSLRNLSWIDLPKSLASIGVQSFSGMSELVSLTIPASVTSIGNSAFSNAVKLVSVVCLSSVPPACGTSIFGVSSSVGTSSLSRIVVPEGFSNEYKAASGWSTYAGLITDGAVDPSSFVVYSSFEGQTFYIDSDDSIVLFLLAVNVNGDVTADWYNYGEYVKTSQLVYAEPNKAVQGVSIGPLPDGTYVIHAVVKNTIDGVSTSVSTGVCTIVFGSDQSPGTGSDLDGRFDIIETELSEVQDAIAGVDGKLDEVSDQLDVLQSGGSAGTDLTDQSGQLSDDLAGIDEFEQSQMDILDSGMVQIKESVSYTSFIPALAFVQKYADMAFDSSISDISIIFYLPMFLGLFFFLCSRVPYNIKDVGPKEKKNSIGFKY